MQTNHTIPIHQFNGFDFLPPKIKIRHVISELSHQWDPTTIPHFNHLLEYIEKFPDNNNNLYAIFQAIIQLPSTFLTAQNLESILHHSHYALEIAAALRFLKGSLTSDKVAAIINNPQQAILISCLLGLLNQFQLSKDHYATISQLIGTLQQDTIDKTHWLHVWLHNPKDYIYILLNHTAIASPPWWNINWNFLSYPNQTKANYLWELASLPKTGLDVTQQKLIYTLLIKNPLLIELSQAGKLTLEDYQLLCNTSLTHQEPLITNWYALKGAHKLLVADLIKANQPDKVKLLYHLPEPLRQDVFITARTQFPEDPQRCAIFYYLHLHNIGMDFAHKINHLNGGEYTLELMSSLPKKNSALKGKIYVSTDGKYVIRQEKGIVAEGVFDAKLIGEESKLSDKLKDKAFIRAILETTSKARHTDEDNLGPLLHVLEKLHQLNLVSPIVIDTVFAARQEQFGFLHRFLELIEKANKLMKKQSPHPQEILFLHERHFLLYAQQPNKNCFAYTLQILTFLSERKLLTSLLSEIICYNPYFFNYKEGREDTQFAIAQLQADELASEPNIAIILSYTPYGLSIAQLLSGFKNYLTPSILNSIRGLFHCYKYKESKENLVSFSQSEIERIIGIAEEITVTPKRCAFLHGNNNRNESSAIHRSFFNHSFFDRNLLRLLFDFAEIPLRRNNYFLYYLEKLPENLTGYNNAYILVPTSHHQPDRSKIIFSFLPPVTNLSLYHITNEKAHPVLAKNQQLAHLLRLMFLDQREIVIEKANFNELLEILGEEKHAAQPRNISAQPCPMQP